MLSLLFCLASLALHAGTTFALPGIQHISTLNVPDSDQIEIYNTIELGSEPSASTVQSSPSKMSKNGNAELEARTLERRKSKVASLQQRFDQLKTTVLNKEPSKITREEQLDISLFRLNVQTQMDNYRRFAQIPYVQDLLKELSGMKDALPKYTDFIDRNSHKSEKLRKNREAVARYYARSKVNNLGLGINIKAPPRSLKWILEDAPLPIQMRRKNQYESRRRIRDRQKLEQDELFKNGWGSKRQRS